MSEEKQIGEVTHYYKKIGVAVVRLTSGGVKVGDSIHVQGHTTDFVQEITSIQIDHKDVDGAKKGDEFGLKLSETVRDGDKVYIVS